MDKDTMFTLAVQLASATAPQLPAGANDKHIALATHVQACYNALADCYGSRIRTKAGSFEIEVDLFASLSPEDLEKARITSGMSEEEWEKFRRGELSPK